MKFASFASFICFASTFFVTKVTGALVVEKLDTYKTGIFDGSAAEIVAFDSTTNLLLVTNAADDVVDVLDLSDPSNVVKVDSIDASLSPNSVSVYMGKAAIAFENDTDTGNGTVAFVDLTDDSFPVLASVTVGILPDALTFTPDGSKVLVACEGQPSDDYTEDPEGSVWVIDSDTYEATCINFQEFDGTEADLNADGIRVYGPNATASQDFEPEYITVSADSMYAVVGLQENNAFAYIDLSSMMIENVVSLGLKDHSLKENAFDASNKDGIINITTRPTMGMYQPDGLVSFVIDGKQYYASANEGDSRDYAGYSEETRVEDLTLDATAFPDAAELQLEANLGRLKTTIANGDEDGDGAYEVIYSYGARSFSIFDEDLNMIYDSGSDLEMALQENIPDYFNSNNDENDSFDSRSDDKGPEPEGLAVAEIGDKTYMFVLCERVSAIIAYDISNPMEPKREAFISNRDFGATNATDAGDLGPESAIFIPAADSPNGENLLVVANEVSGTTTIYTVIVDDEKKDDDETFLDEIFDLILGPILDFICELTGLCL